MSYRAYSEPGSFDRIREAAHALADVDTGAASDVEFHRADARLRAAVNGYLRQALRRLTTWQRRGGRAAWAGLTPEQRSAELRRRWAVRRAKASGLPKSAETSAEEGGK